MADNEFKVVRNDGALYMVCDRETAMRLMRQLNEFYKDVYHYHVEQVTHHG